MYKTEGKHNCPVCIGTVMQKLQFDKHKDLTLDFCKRCGGMWFDCGEVQQLRGLHPSYLSQKIELNNNAFKMSCHSCHQLIDRNATNCHHCNWKNIIDCPICEKPMKVKTHSGFQLDYCKTCKGVWFDNIELSEIWNGILGKLSKTKKDSIIADHAAITLIDVLTIDPYFVSDSIGLIGDAGQSTIEITATAVTNAPEIAGAIVEGGGELAGGVFEAICEIVGGVFS
jgi:Zn-finger nucleic acid-binding protein